MNPMIIPGLKSKKELIIESCKSFLNVKDIEGRKSDVAGCKRMIVFVAQEFYDERLQDYANMVNVDHPTVIHYRKKYGSLYYGESLIYNFLFLTIKNKVAGRKFYYMSDLYEMAAEKMDLNFVERGNLQNHLGSRRVSGATKNRAVKAFILFFLKNRMSAGEIKTLIGSTSSNKDLTSIELENKELYLYHIESTIKELIKNLTEK